MWLGQCIMDLQKCFQNAQVVSRVNRLCNEYFPTEVELYLHHLSCANIIWLVYDRWPRYVLKHTNKNYRIAPQTSRNVFFVQSTIIVQNISVKKGLSWGGINNDYPEASNERTFHVTLKYCILISFGWANREAGFWIELNRLVGQRGGNFKLAEWTNLSRDL